LESYVLNELADHGIIGTASFYGHMNGKALAVLDIDNTPADCLESAHIHIGDKSTLRWLVNIQTSKW
tara:strand:- start:47734 stop:47934 length:201 start_codon:yes stop_codon:yes gene_type:complete